MTTVYSAWAGHVYSWGTGKTRCRLEVESTQTATVKTVTVSGATQCHSTYNLSGYGVKVTVGRRANDHYAAASTSATGYYAGGTGWRAQASTSWTFQRKRSAYTVVLYCSYEGAAVDGYGAAGTYNKGSVSFTVTVPALPSYAVTYYANGGSGAPSAQTKWHGTALTLRTGVPTRDGYIFKGWATSASGAVVYKAGGTYSGNAALSLYAVWEAANKPPLISALTARRCLQDGTPSEYGTYVVVAFSYSVDDSVEGNKAVSCQVLVRSAAGEVAKASPSASSASGKVSAVLGGTLSVDTAYSVTVSMTDSESSTGSASVSLPTALFPLEFLGDGSGASFGKPAELSDVLDVNWAVMPRGGLASPDGSTVESNTPIRTFACCRSVSAVLTLSTAYVKPKLATLQFDTSKGLLSLSSDSTGIVCSHDGVVAVSAGAYASDLTAGDNISVQVWKNSASVFGVRNGSPKATVSCCTQTRTVAVAAGDVISIAVANLTAARGSVAASGASTLFVQYLT